ncbi:hypothetical protein [Ruminococcus sp. Marseille-P6503]|uniref:hypothetical protein n=1 Tax=Ruminococcus sp. Marseille-P6503 TaxID=2364796 RepID=UPI000F546E8E|nr:hypothetical protein [Ruminococcus sp. Marseille-P6503]
MPKLKAAAYCRVSSGHKEQESSRIVQKAHYEKYIQNNKNWILVDIYADTKCASYFKSISRKPILTLSNINYNLIKLERNK